MLEACASYPSGVPLRGQSEAMRRSDRDACRAYAADEVESPVLAGLGKKAVMAVGGAVVGAGFVILIFSGGSDSPPHINSSEDSKALAIAIGAGAALGFVLGSIAGTFVGADETLRAVEARENVFARCMKERGYEMPRPSPSVGEGNPRRVPLFPSEWLRTPGGG